MTIVRLTVIAALLCLAPASALADDRAKAAEHFALAEKAEAREDWRAAIAQYELAYEASPHPSVQFNIAKNYERLGAARDAARHYRRYLDESKQAPDRAKVEERLTELRARPSKVQVIGRPAGAQVIVDDRPRGPAPITLTLEAGEHVIALEQSGRRSQPQRVTVEYGDPMTVRIDLNVVPGTLMVFANVDGAEVQIDGKTAGYTPLTGQLPAGSYELQVSKPGYRTAQRKIEVPAGGSRQVRLVMERIDGKPAGTEEGPRRSKYLFGWVMGFDAGSGDSIRYLLDLGYRTPNNRFEASLLIGAFGGNGGVGVGADAKVFLATKRIRPYVKAALLAGSTSSSSDDKVTSLEGGAGVLISAARRERARYALDYFIELDLRVTLQEPAMDVSRIGIPIVGGILFRYGGN